MSDARIDVYLLDLDPSDEDVERLTALLEPDELAAAKRFMQPDHGRRYRVRRGRLREILAEYSGVGPGEIRYRKGAHGKPELAIGGEDVHFNSSHSAGMAMIGVSRVAPLGVDIEYMKDIADRDAVVGRFFSLAERTAFKHLPEQDKRQAFYNGWTRKEAVIKATGEGLHATLDTFDVTLVPGEPPRIAEIDGDPDLAAQWRLFDVEPSDGYAGAVAMHPPAALRDQLSITVRNPPP